MAGFMWAKIIVWTAAYYPEKPKKVFDSLINFVGNVNIGSEGLE